jgi:hypothetical protein
MFILTYVLQHAGRHDLPLPSSNATYLLTMSN